MFLVWWSWPSLKVTITSQMWQMLLICTWIVISRKIFKLWHSNLAWRLTYAWDIYSCFVDSIVFLLIRTWRRWPLSSTTTRWKWQKCSWWTHTTWSVQISPASTGTVTALKCARWRSALTATPFSLPAGSKWSCGAGWMLLCVVCFFVCFACWL